jgi:anti-sigma28 factor (negative regulator of flagellin synthesis)
LIKQTSIIEYPKGKTKDTHSTSKLEHDLARSTMETSVMVSILDRYLQKQKMSNITISNNLPPQLTCEITSGTYGRSSELLHQWHWHSKTSLVINGNNKKISSRR